MTGDSFRSAIVVSCLMLLVAGCDALLTGPVRDNPNDPGSPDWTTQRPFIYKVAKTADNKVQVSWLCSTTYGIYFRVERRIVNTPTYTLIGTVPGSAATNAFIDSTNIPLGHTYGYRVGVVGSAGAVTYSYDMPIDIF
jgi:hypothetical protein